MNGIAVHDGTGPGEGSGLTFDLAELLDALGPPALAARWRPLPEVSYVSDVEIPAFEETVFGPGAWMSGAELMEASRTIRQVIDGRFEARRRQTDDRPWLILRAVDSSWWEVYSDDAAVETALRRTFHDLRPAKYSEGAG